MKTLKCLFVGLLVFSFAAFIVPMQVSAEIIECPPPTCPPPPEITVTKTVDPSIHRYYDWTITKVAKDLEGGIIGDSLTLMLGQPYNIHYEVTVDATPHDVAWFVNGIITVTNNTPDTVTINGITDFVGAVQAHVFCDFPIELLPGHSLDCEYNAELTGPIDCTNTATVDTSLGDFSTTAPVLFCDATIHHKDNCVELNDSYAGRLTPSEVHCVGSGVPATFDYYREIIFRECGDFPVDNCAEFITNCTHTTGSACKEIMVTVECDLGCTRTPGYWKTHAVCLDPAEDPGAPRDNTWDSVGGENSDFYFSGQSWCGVLWTSRRGGNAYYHLAHAYIAAVLNVASGASTTPAVDTAMADAEALFNNPLNTPTAIRKLNGKAPLRKQFLGLAEILDEYNNGLSGGPLKCDVDEDYDR